MSKTIKMNRAATAVLLAAAFAGSGLSTIGTALSLPFTGPVWLAASVVSALCGVIALSGAGTLIGGGLLAAAVLGYTVTHIADLRAVRVFLAAWQQGGTVIPDVIVPGSHAFLICGAALFGALFFLLLYRRGFTGMAIMLLASMLIFSHGMSPRASIATAVPGLVAGAAAFAMSDGVQRDHWALRVLLPSALAVALALLLLPGSRTTWGPMEDLASRVRNMFEQYFNFTHERVAFSIGEEGYNHGGEINGQPVAMLGGPANPDPSPVMRVTADGPLLLRGAIRATYTGYSWVDVAPKSRYLYFDVTHRSVRDRVFDLNHQSPEDAFTPVSAEVELIDSATSTLFTPGRLTRFDMDLSVAVYYNSSGEMFMAREAQPGDHYALETLSAEHGDALAQAALWGENDSDSQYASILAAHSQLPDGIDAELYALTGRITAAADTSMAKAEAIASYLRRNMRYRLDVEYPPRGRDFASWFVLDSQQGYCSYFATAMAVMGRIAGLPTRYVEGYYVRPGEDGTTTLTGLDAHAWAEVYFRGLGWIPFDCTNGGPAAGETGGEDAYGYGADGEASEEETPFDDPEQETEDPSDGDDANLAPEDEDPETTPEPDSTEDESDLPEDQDEMPDIQDEAEDASDRRASWGWLWALLILLLLLLAAWWVRRRLQQSDPEHLCKQTRRSQQAAMIVYRASLTLLSHMGQVPQGGETPEAFVERVSKELSNPDYADFARAVTLNRYGGRPMKRADVDVGLRAYRRFKNGMRPMERVRFTATRILRGLGDFEAIP